MTILVETLKRELKDVHLFMTAWAKDVSKPGDPPCLEPAFTPAAAKSVNGRFDSILYIGIQDQNGKPVRVLRSQGNGRVMARDRDDRLPEKIANPTMQLLAKYWGLDSSLVEQ